MKKRMKVLHVLTDKNIGGAGRWLLYYLKYHDRTQFEVRVVLPADSALCERVRALDVPVIALEEMQDKSYDPQAMRALVRLFRAERPDIVHTHASLTARMAARRAKVPLLVQTKHCMEGAAGSLAKRLLRRAVNRRYSDEIIAVSKAVRRSMIAGGTEAKQITVIYNGIDPLPVPTAAEKAARLARYGGRDGETAIGIAARLEEVKDHEMLLRAAQKLLQTRQDVRFYIVGDGSLRQRLEERAKELGIAENVVFTGFLAEVGAMEAAFDIAVITSKEEALCLSVLESMSAGIPAVGTDSGGVAEVIRHGENGYLVPVGDSDALAARLAELVADTEKRRTLGAQAAQDVAQTFLAERMTKRLEKRYREAKR